MNPASPDADLPARGRWVRTLRAVSTVRLIPLTPRVSAGMLCRTAAKDGHGARRLVLRVVLEGISKEVVDIVAVRHRAPHGGHYWSVACPRCRSGRKHLYVLAGALLCAACHGIDYAGNKYSKTRWLKDVWGPMKRSMLERDAAPARAG